MHGDEKAIKGKCIVIIKGPKIKVRWSESDKRQSCEYHKVIKENDMIMRMRPNAKGWWSKSNQRQRYGDQKVINGKVWWW
jgi:hypothetical protein